MLKTIKKSLATKISLYISFFIILAFLILGITTIIKVRNYNRNTIIERSEGEINSLLQITANINSVLMQQLRTYTMFICNDMRDPVEIQKTLIEYNKARYKDFISVSYIDYKSGLQYNDNNTITAVSTVDYYNIMKNQRIVNKSQQLYGDIHKSGDPENPYWYPICKDVELKDEKGYPIGFFMGQVSTEYIQRFIDKLKKENSFEYKDGFFAILDTEGIYVCAPERNSVGKNIKDKDIKISNNIATFIHNPVDRIGKEKVTVTGYIIRNNIKYSVTVGMFTKTYNWVLLIATPYFTIDEMSDKLLMTIIIISSLSAIILLFLSIIILTKSFIPLEMLNFKIGEMSKSNVDLTKRLNVTSNDEIGQLEKSFNKYLQQLQVMVTDLKNSKDNLLLNGRELENIFDRVKNLLRRDDSEAKFAEIDILERKSSKELKDFYKNIDEISKEIDDFKI